MDNKILFEFDNKQAYRLIRVTDTNGVDKTDADELYSSVAGCVACDLRYDLRTSYVGAYRMYLDFVQDESGTWINRTIHTSPVLKVEVTEDGLNVHTCYSVYVFEKATLQETPVCADKNTIELYLSMDEKYHFAKGFYRDEEGKSHELCAHVHTGMLVDTVLIGAQDTAVFGEYVCRYFYRSTIEFYDTLYHQQDYSMPMLIHNTSKERDLVVCFERYDKQWTIAPGESKRIIPFSPMGADVEGE